MTQLYSRASDYQKKIWEKTLFYRGKWQRARKYEISRRHYEEYMRYNDLNTRALNLIQRLSQSMRRSKYLPVDPINWDAEAYKRSLERKEERRQKFLSKRIASIWFFQSRLSADYGMFTCDECGRTFYHSPSTIKKAAKEIIHCCCGHCTNKIISQDWGECPFE